MKTQPLAHLLWKDYRILRPLLLFVGALSVFLIFSQTNKVLNPVSRFTIAVEMGILVPHIFALLAPLILLGYERDRGTLQWLRHFPYPWKNIATSHHTSAFLGLLALWIFSGINVAVATSLNGWPSSETSITSSVFPLILPTAHLLLSSISWLALAFLLTHLTGTTAIASIPIVLFGYVMILSSIDGAEHAFFSKNVLGIGVPSRIAWPLGMLIGARLLLEALLRLKAKQKDDSLKLSIILPSLTQTESTKNRRRGAGRPTVWRALLWQQSRQIAPTILIWTLASLGLSALSWLDRSNPDRFWFLGPIALVFTTIAGMFSLGVMTFYQDNLTRNKMFLAERGIEATIIWWTRIIPAISGFLFFLILYILLTMHAAIFATPPTFNYPHLISPQPLRLALPCTLLFVAGILISQSFERPIYAFLLTPFYWIILWSVFEVWSSNQQLPYALASIILLVASYRLTRPWVDGRVDLRFAGKVVGFTAIATIPWIVFSLI